MIEGEYPAAVLGGACGLLIDATCGRIFGYSSVIIIAICVTSVLLFKHLLFQNILNIIWLTAVFSSVYQLLDYFFMYYIVYCYSFCTDLYFGKTCSKKILPEKV